MARTIEGKLNAEGLRFAVLVSRFNGFVTEQLLKGALDALTRHGARDADVEVYKVPGSFELVGLARRVALTGRYDAVVALSAIIRGGTPHFEYLSAEVTRGLMQVALEAPCPVAYGVLTCDTAEQAIDRAGIKAGNKGAEAASAAIESAHVWREAGNGKRK